MPPYVPCILAPSAFLELLLHFMVISICHKFYQVVAEGAMVMLYYYLHLFILLQKHVSEKLRNDWIVAGISRCRWPQRVIWFLDNGSSDPSPFQLIDIFVIGCWAYQATSFQSSALLSVA